MIEHRTIERAIEILSVERKRLEAGGELDTVFIDKIVDFIRTYADRCHHGKEEDILFESLESKELSESEAALMQELVDEHKYGRELTKRLVAAKDAVVAGDLSRLGEVLEVTGKLVEFYPETERHYDKAELDAMLKKFYDFDMQMIHDKYVSTVEALEAETK